MQTRSKTRQLLQQQEVNQCLSTPPFDVFIDFDEASKAWRANKKPIKNGCYKYICSKETKSGNTCKREAITGCDFCKIHRKTLHRI
jgi:hypothetical protein